jgi:hypothetical protein
LISLSLLIESQWDEYVRIEGGREEDDEGKEERKGDYLSISKFQDHRLLLAATQAGWLAVIYQDYVAQPNK